VAACKRADTGVGPSIACGNQVFKPNWALLAIAPINNNIHINVIRFELFITCAIANIEAKSKVPNNKI